MKGRFKFAIYTNEERIILFDNNGNIVYKFEYNLQDHLGNTRVVFSGHSNGQPELMQVTDYYPFGMVMNQTNTFADGVLPNKYLYNNKELQDDELAGNSLGWYDYGARFYDAELARFHTLDKLSENYYFQSSYAYAVNNPLRFIDFIGMGPGDIIKRRYSNLEHGKMVSVKYVVLHQTGTPTLKHSENNYSNPNTKAGAHYLIDKDGTAYLTASTNQVAWHVGKPKKDVTNRNSIGIEMVGAPTDKIEVVDGVSYPVYEDITKEQQEALNILLPLLYGEFNLNESNVYKHPEVSWKIPSEARSSVIPSKDSSDKEKEQQNTTDSNSSWDDFMNWMSSNSLWDKLK